MISKNTNVEGLTCNHCVKTIMNKVSILSGVDKVEIDLNRKLVSVDFEAALISITNIEEVIIDAGFEINN